MNRLSLSFYVQENTDWNTTSPDHVVQALTGLFDKPLLERTQQQLVWSTRLSCLQSLCCPLYMLRNHMQICSFRTHSFYSVIRSIQ